MSPNVYHILNRLLIAGFFVFNSCSPPKYDFSKNLPNHFSEPVVQEIDFITTGNMKIGRLLFYEKALSEDSSVSCGSYHSQKLAFADSLPISPGVHGYKGFRNAQPLINLIYKNTFFRDGGVNTIARATIPPMQTDFEMDMNIRDVLERLNSNKKYKKLFIQEFGEEANHKNVLQSLAAFQSALLSNKSDYDFYLSGDSSALSEDAKAGMQLFFSDKLACSTCHSSTLFSDGKWHNLGLSLDNPDYGLGRVTLDPLDFGKFKTPSLRNIAVTAPYMHNGTLATLNSVLDFYAQGGENHKNKSDLMKPFKITEIEKKQLVLFLESLTDSSFLNNPAFTELSIRD